MSDVKDPSAAEIDRRTDAVLEEAQAYFMGEGGVRNAAASPRGVGSTRRDTSEEDY
jgi:hypothetical protein